MRDGVNKSYLYSNAEPRALPLKDADVQHIRAQNLRLSSAKPKKVFGADHLTFADHQISAIFILKR